MLDEFNKKLVVMCDKYIKTQAAKDFDSILALITEQSKEMHKGCNHSIFFVMYNNKDNERWTTLTLNCLTGEFYFHSLLASEVKKKLAHVPGNISDDVKVMILSTTLKPELTTLDEVAKTGLTRLVISEFLKSDMEKTLHLQAIHQSMTQPPASA